MMVHAYTPIIQALGKLRQEDHRLKVNLGNFVRPSLKNESDRFGDEDKDGRDGGRIRGGEGGKEGN